MKNQKVYYILGGVLSLIAAVFLCVALTNPQLSFPWPNWVSYVIYALYLIYIVLIFCMPKFKNASLAACGSAAGDFAALALIAVYIGTRNTPNENVLYLIIALALTAFANLGLVLFNKKNNGAAK